MPRPALNLKFRRANLAPLFWSQTASTRLRKHPAFRRAFSRRQRLTSNELDASMAVRCCGAGSWR